MTEHQPSDEAQAVSDLALPVYSAPKGRMPCPGQPRVITGSI